MWMINLVSSGTAASVAIFASGFATWISPRHATAIFLGVFLTLAAAAFPALCHMLRRAGQAWDALWDEDGRSWAVLEAEHITEQATEPPTLPPTGGDNHGHTRPQDGRLNP